MSLYKLIKPSWFLLLMLIVMVCPSVLAKTVTIRVAILDQLMSQKLSSITYQEDYFKGIEVAVRVAKRQQNINVIYKYFDYEKKPLGVLNAVQRVRNWNPDFIIGPRSSNSFLLIKNEFKNILVVSPLASSQQINKLPDNFYSFSLADAFIAKALSIFTLKYINNVKGVLSVTANDCLSCKNISEQYIKYINESGRVSSLVEYFTSVNVENFDLSKINRDYRLGYVILMPNISYVSGVLITRIVNYIKKDNVTFIGGDGWGSHDIAYVGKMNVKYRFNAYHVQNWSLDLKCRDLNEFKKNYYSIYGEDTTDNIAYISYYTLNRILSVIKVGDIKGVDDKKEYILSNFLHAAKKSKNAFKQLSYVIYKYDAVKDIPIASVNTNTWEIKRFVR